MGVPTLLWIVFAANAAIYFYSGRFVISRPRHLRPRLFWNPTMLWIAGVAPPAFFVALVVAAFAFTDSGWSLLVASVIAYVAFAVRPACDLSPWWMAGTADTGDRAECEHIVDNVATSTGTEAKAVFLGSMPDPGEDGPAVFRVGDQALSYYENPQTIGEKAGVQPLFKYPQLAVFRTATGDPWLIVRVEDWSGTSRLLCSVEPSGAHRTFGPWATSDRKAFVEKAVEIASGLDGGKGGR